MKVTDEMVRRFLGCTVPVSYDEPCADFFTETQAREMLEHVLGGERDRDISEIIAEAEKEPRDATALDGARSQIRDHEYRKIWLERAASRYDFDITGRPHDEFPGFAVDAFDAADAFIAGVEAEGGEMSPY
jgi:hypothetical protein